MSKYIKLEDAIKAIEEMQNCYNGWSDTYDKAQIIEVLEELPTIDIVRCEDCKYWDNRFGLTDTEGSCEYLGGMYNFTDADYYCASGERI